MLSLADGAEVFIHLAPSDMRLGFERLSAKIRADLCRTPLAGGYFPEDPDVSAVLKRWDRIGDLAYPELETAIGENRMGPGEVISGRLHLPPVTVDKREQQNRLDGAPLLIQAVLLLAEPGC